LRPRLARHLWNDTVPDTNQSVNDYLVRRHLRRNEHKPRLGHVPMAHARSILGIGAMVDFSMLDRRINEEDGQRRDLEMD
jgi:hypothetical protein